jgi:hypothetical protein
MSTTKNDSKPKRRPPMSRMGTHKPSDPRLTKEHQDKLRPKDFQEKICSAIKQGNYIETSAVYSGVSKETLYLWFKLGHKAKKEGNLEDEHYVFLNAVQEAVAFSEMRDLQRLDKFGEQDWRVIAWKMERRHGGNWGQKQEIKHSGEIDTTAPVVIVDEVKLAAAMKKLDKDY